MGITLRRRWVRLTLSYVVAIAGVGIGAYILVPKSSELRAIATVINDSDTWLLFVAGALELLSIWFYALTTRALAQQHRTNVSRRYILLVTIAASAIGNSLPLGAGVSALYAFRKLEDRSVPKKEAALAVGATNALAVATLALLAALTVPLGGDSVLSGADVVVLLAVGALSFVLVGYAHFVVGVVSYALEFLRSMPRYKVAGARRRAQERRASNLRFELSRSSIAFGSLFALLNWLFDLLALLLSVHIVHAKVPLFGVVAAYFVGALAANLPITPGGLGVVEGSLAVSLIAFGGGKTSVLAAVLLYRLVSFWIWLPLGWAVHFVLSYLNHRRWKDEGRVETSEFSAKEVWM